jgi:hypothetical protein
VLEPKRLARTRFTSMVLLRYPFAASARSATHAPTSIPPFSRHKLRLPPFLRLHRFFRVLHSLRPLSRPPHPTPQVQLFGCSFQRAPPSPMHLRRFNAALDPCAPFLR